MILKIFCALLFALVLAEPLSAQELPFFHYTPDREVNPLPGAGVGNVYQDRLGFLWIASYGAGLIRYDGHRMELYAKAEGLADLSVTDIVEDRTGRLWVASAGGLVVSEAPLAAYEHGRRVRFTAAPGGIPLVAVWLSPNHLALDAEGRLWVATDADGIIRYQISEAGAVQADTIGTDVYGNGKNEVIYSILARRDGTIWAGLFGGAMLVLDGDEGVPEITLREGEAIDASITALYETASGVLWGGCYSGAVWRLDERAGTRRVGLLSKDLSDWVSSLLETPDGTVWASSQGSGVLRVDASGQTEVLTRSAGLLSDFVNRIARDREGNLWFAQNQGLSKLQPDYAAFLGYTAASRTGEKPALIASSVYAVVPPASGGPPCIWVGTEAGVVCLSPDGQSQYLSKAEGLGASEAYAVAPDPVAGLWIGMNGLTVKLSPAASGAPSRLVASSRRIPVLGEPWRLTTYDISNVYAIKRFALPVEDGSQRTVESLWLLSYLKVVCLVGNEWFIFRQEAGFPPTSSGSAALDETGRLWVGTDDQGLLRSRFPLSLERLRRLLQNNSPREMDDGRRVRQPVFEPVWNQDAGAPSDNIQALLWHEGTLWVGTPDGLYVLAGDSLKVTARLHRAQGLVNDNVLSMAVSPVTGTLWLGTYGGLAEVDMDARRVIRIVTVQDGLLDDEVTFHGALAVGADGAVYFGTPKGLSYYRPALEAKNSVPPLLQVRQVHFDEDRRGDNMFSIEYAALSFSSEREVRYKTRLIGYQDAWSEEKGDVTFQVTNLPAFLLPKRYVFEVTARNDDGVWVPEALAYAFTVHPAWWATWWFVALVLAGTLAAAVGGHRLRVRELRRRERVLQALVEARTESLKQEKERTEALNQRLQADVERKTRELSEARALQLSMLPAEPPQFEDLDIAFYMSTASEVGGDYYDFHVDDQGTLTVAIGDATGHGMRAGIVVATTKSYFQSLAAPFGNLEILRRISQGLREMQLRGMYMSLTLLKYRQGEVRLTAAGMPPALHYCRVEEQVEAVVLKGMPLGAFVDFPYQEQCFTLAPGDVLLLMSDGLLELFSPARDMLGEECVRACFHQAAGGEAGEVIARLRELARAWMQEGTQNDDISLLVIKRKGGQPGVIRRCACSCTGL